MPFAELPSSHMQVPAPPNWTQFGAQANEFIANQPHPNLAQAVQQAVGQIDEILKLSSPEAKMGRALQMMQMQAMYHTYQDYNAHPENYMMTAHGPVLRDETTRALKISQIARNAAYIKSLGRQGQLPPELASAIDKIKAIKAGKYKLSQATDNAPAQEAISGTETNFGNSNINESPDYYPPRDDGMTDYTAGDSEDGG